MHWVVILAIALHVSLTTWLAFARYASVHHHTFDLALHARLAWGLWHGLPWDSIVGGHFFGGHVPLVLWPLGALGLWFGTVPVLLVAQSLAVALAAWPLYRLASRRLGAALGVAVAMVWLLQPNLGHVASYEMHPGTLALWPMCAAFDAFDRRKPWSFALLCALVVACRASLAMQTCAMGVLACWLVWSNDRSMRRAAACVALGSVAYFAFVQMWLAPRFGPALASSLDLHFGRWGGSPGGVIVALFQRPHAVFEHFAAPRRLSYLLRVLLPFAWLPLLRPRWLLCALPPLAINLISEFPTTTELYSHYLTPALPALAMALVEGLAALRLAPLRIAKAALPIAAAAGSTVWGGLPWSLDFAPGDFQTDARSTAAADILRQVPPRASIQAPDALLPHLCERPLPCRAPPPERGTDYVVLDTQHRRRFARREDLLRTIEEPVARAWLARSDHGLIAAAGDFLLFARGASARATFARRYFAQPIASGAAPGVALTACLSLTAAELAERLTLRLQAHAACPTDLALRWGAASHPQRVDLLFDGLLSPAQLRSGDRVYSEHVVTAEERAALGRGVLHLGVLRANGKPPAASDPVSVEVPLARDAPR